MQLLTPPATTTTSTKAISESPTNFGFSILDFRLLEQESETRLEEIIFMRPLSNRKFTIDLIRNLKLSVTLTGYRGAVKSKL